MLAMSGVPFGMVTETFHEQTRRVLVEMSEYFDRPFVVRMYVEVRYLSISYLYRPYHKFSHDEEQMVRNSTC